jgi:transposase
MKIATLTAFISHFLHYLLKLRNNSAEKIAETGDQKFGQVAWAKAQAIWNQLRPKLEGKEATKEAATDVAKHPKDQELQLALRVQLKKLLDQDEELGNAIAKTDNRIQILESIPGVGRKTAEVIVAFIDDAKRFKTADRSVLMLD